MAEERDGDGDLDATAGLTVVHADPRQALLAQHGLRLATPNTRQLHDRSVALKDDPKLREVRRSIGLESRSGWRRTSLRRTDEFTPTLTDQGFVTAASPGSTVSQWPPESPPAGSAGALTSLSHRPALRHSATLPHQSLQASLASVGRSLTSPQGATGRPTDQPEVSLSMSMPAQSRRASMSRSTTMPVLSRRASGGLDGSMQRADTLSSMRAMASVQGMLPSLDEEDFEDVAPQAAFEQQAERLDAKAQYRTEVDRAINRLLQDLHMARAPEIREEDSHGIVCRRVDAMHDFYEKHCKAEATKPHNQASSGGRHFLSFDPDKPPPPGSLRGRDVTALPEMRLVGSTARRQPARRNLSRSALSAPTLNLGPKAGT